MGQHLSFSLSLSPQLLQLERSNRNKSRGWRLPADPLHFLTFRNAEEEGKVEKERERERERETKPAGLLLLLLLCARQFVLLLLFLLCSPPLPHGFWAFFVESVCVRESVSASVSV